MEVNVGASTGKVAFVKFESAADEANERRDEAKEKKSKDENADDSR